MLQRGRPQGPMLASWTFCAALWLSVGGCTLDASNLSRPAREAAAEQRDVGREVERGDVQGGRTEGGGGGTDLMNDTAGQSDAGPRDAGSEVSPPDIARDATRSPEDDVSPSDARAPREDVSGDGSGGGGEDTSPGGDAADAADSGPTPDAHTPDAGLSNLALAGTAYRWSGNRSSTANTNRVAEAKLNDDSTASDVNLAGKGWDEVKDAWEAAGVILARAATVTKVVFVNGSFTRQETTFSGDGNFVANFHLQLSTDGTVWTDAKGWSLSPAYPHDASASNGSYVFSGNATGVLGVRITGQVRLADNLEVSWYASSREVQVWGYN